MTEALEYEAHVTDQREASPSPSQPWKRPAALILYLALGPFAYRMKKLIKPAKTATGDRQSHMSLNYLMGLIRQTIHSMV